MILVDFSQIYIASFMAETKGNVDTPIEPALVRHIALNMLRGINVKFRQEYGSMVIAADSNSWRRDVWPYYKAHRSKDKAKSIINWPKLYECLNQVGNEINEHFPYPYIKVDGAEGDDIIATIVIEHAGEKNPDNEILNLPSKKMPVMIVSGDQDFVQLQTYSNVKQYDPIRKRFYVEKNPEQYLFEHILEGDREDGVPNFLSPDNAFVDHIRQKPLTKKWREGSPILWSPELTHNFDRNAKMIDLTLIPGDIKRKIMQMFEGQLYKPTNKMFNYFFENNLTKLMQQLTDFK